MRDRTQFGNFEFIHKINMQLCVFAYIIDLMWIFLWFYLHNIRSSIIIKSLINFLESRLQFCGP